MIKEPTAVIQNNKLKLKVKLWPTIFDCIERETITRDTNHPSRYGKLSPKHCPISILWYEKCDRSTIQPYASRHWDFTVLDNMWIPLIHLTKCIWRMEKLIWSKSIFTLLTRRVFPPCSVFDSTTCWVLWIRLRLLQLTKVPYPEY